MITGGKGVEQISSLIDFNEEWNTITSADFSPSKLLISEINGLLFEHRAHHNRILKTKACIILGSTQCSYRALQTLEIFAGNDTVTFLACGGSTAFNEMTEARLIASLLLDHGVDESRILIDEHSSNTHENLVHAAELIEGHFRDAFELEIAIVSAAFHRRRVMSLLPPSLSHAFFVNTYGPNTRPDNWYLNEIGRRTIFAELLSLSGRRT